MDEMNGQTDILQYEPPLPEDLAEELLRFWEATFDTSYDWIRAVLAGSEQGQNRDIVFLVRQGEALAGTNHLTISASKPELGGLGEVGTVPAYRRQGIATALCERARETFRAQGGRALFLGTGNPAAARVYHRLGWRKLASAGVMACITSGDSPEAFLVDYYRGCHGDGEGGAITVAEGSAAARIPMIPLLVTPHDWQAMDANANMFSMRYAVQLSCMGLYPRYEKVTREGRGTWFVAQTDQGRAVGLSTARLDDAGGCQVDGFVHHRYPQAWGDLMGAALSWAAARGASLCFVALSIEDEDKRAQFEALGFRQIGECGAFDLDGRRVTSLRLEKGNDGGKRGRA